MKNRIARRAHEIQFSLDQLGFGETVTYGEAKTFETEGDMYEYLTGHRSKVIDDAEKK